MASRNERITANDLAHHQRRVARPPELSGAPLQVFRHDPALYELIQPFVGSHHFLACGRQFVRRILDSLDAIRVRQAARELAYRIIELVIGFADSRSGLYNSAHQGRANLICVERRFTLGSPQIRALNADRYTAAVEFSFNPATGTSRHPSTVVLS